MLVKKTAFKGRILMLGCGSVAQCTLPLILRHLDMPPSKITCLDFVDNRDKITDALKQGVTYKQEQITRENLAHVLGTYVGQGDMIIDLAWNIGAVDILDWCHKNNVRYINTSVEMWDPYEDMENKSTYHRTLYFRQMQLRKLKAKWKAGGTSPGPTAIIDHGANPGLVSHFVKRALLEIGAEIINRSPLFDLDIDREKFERILDEAKGEKPGAFARLAQATRTKTIHISERDTQISAKPKEVDEFVNTWSIEGFFEEGTAPAELGWGTHERRLPKHAQLPEGGPGNQIFIARPGIRTYVHSWVPLGGEIIGMVVRHAEAFTISDYLTVWNETHPLYRPTVHYAYMPCDNAVISLYELTMKNYNMQSKLRIMNDEIIDGRDELGVLLMGHPLNGWWVGSQLDIHESRKLVPGQNATTLQVAAAVLGGVIYMIKNPDRGLLVPEDLPHIDILEVAYPYLGNCPSLQTDWNPIKSRANLFDKCSRPRVSEDDKWQFTTFLVD
ncbi:MAG: homospermidine synthase [Nitrospirae bacterium]|nr:homospermidine synthase [Nitrospirota bacterium]